MGNASYPRKKEFYGGPSWASITAAGFICLLLVNIRPASQEAVIGKNLSYFDLFRCLFLIFFRLNFNIIEACPKVMYLCTFSSRRNASRLSHDTISPRCASWKSKKKENIIGKHTFWTEMKFTENLNSRELQICDIKCLESHVRRRPLKKSLAWTFSGEEYVSLR